MVVRSHRTRFVSPTGGGPYLKTLVLYLVLFTLISRNLNPEKAFTPELWNDLLEGIQAFTVNQTVP